MSPEEFNAAHPVGTPVVAYPGVRPDDPAAEAFGVTRIVTRTRTEAWSAHGTPVVMVNDHGAWIALTHIDVIDLYASTRGEPGGAA
jgi:hypothetical protein